VKDGKGKRMPINVLLVDDSDVIREMILKTMRLARVPLGETYQAGNGQEALDTLEREWVDIALVDINMPVMDGKELISRLRASERFADLPIVVVTTEGAEISIERLRELGVTAFLRKPFTPEQIRDVIAEVAGRIVDTEHRELLEGVLGQVLQLFAMMYCEAQTSRDGDVPAGELIQATMPFSGGATGSLIVAAPLELCREMAANALGIDVEDERAGTRAGDAVGEFVNMSCGLIATNIDARDETKLSPPLVESIGADDWAALADSGATVRFTVEERPMLVSLSLRQG
jgi:two-component system chemotaxis response regulator CheY